MLLQLHRLMSQALATVSTGTSLALVRKLLEGAPHPLSLCPARPPFEIHWFSLCLGVAIGLLLGPLLEVIVYLRYALVQAALRVAVRAGGSIGELGAPRPLHRLL